MGYLDDDQGRIAILCEDDDLLGQSVIGSWCQILSHGAMRYGSELKLYVTSWNSNPN